MRVLVVDDSSTVRRIISAALKELGVRDVQEAESADAAKQILRGPAKTDLIITDWHMPGISGLELLKQLRASERFKSTPVIMSTSESAGDNVVSAIQAGATNYIIKPFNKQQFLDKVGPIIKAGLLDELAERSGGAAADAVVHAGILREGALGEVLQFFVQTGKTGCCELTCANCVAKVLYERGRICGCEYQGQKGETAFFTCFLVPVKSYRFSEGPIEIPSGVAAIQRDSHALLLEATAHSDRTRL